ncbi:hypothetical protein Tco_0600976 [Tanacetum coccineum]
MWSFMPVIYDKYALWGISHWGQKRQQFHGFAINKESACDVYSRHRIIAVTKLQIIEWHNYKHLDWITVRRNDDKLTPSSECFIANVYKKHCYPKAYGKSSVRCQKLPKEAQSHKAGYIQIRSQTIANILSIPNPRGFIYQNKYKKNKLICIDELHKFSDGTLNDVRNALDDILKRIGMKYMPQKVNKGTAGAMI